MLTRIVSRPLAVGAAVVVIGGGAYGIVSATSSSGSAGASTEQTAQAGSMAKSGSNARSGPAAGGVVGTVSSVSTSSFTVSTSAGQKVTDIPEGDELDHGECHYHRQTCPRTRYDQRNDHHGNTGHRATGRRGTYDFLAVKGGPLHARSADHVKAGRQDPGELQ